jgi:predicted sulfurtransferase
MRFLISLVFVILGAIALISCNSAEKLASQKPAANSNAATAATPQAKATDDGVRRITTAELRDLISKGQAVVIDVRNEATYKAGHIRGAKLIPTNVFLSRINELPRDKTIVTYCS